MKTDKQIVTTWMRELLWEEFYGKAIEDHLGEKDSKVNRAVIHAKAWVAYRLHHANLSPPMNTLIALMIKKPSRFRLEVEVVPSDSLYVTARLVTVTDRLTKCTISFTRKYRYSRKETNYESTEGMPALETYWLGLAVDNVLQKHQKARKFRVDMYLTERQRRKMFSKLNEFYPNGE